MTAPLVHLIAEAAALAGGNLCAAGHDWRSVGGRMCERCEHSQAVYQCARCGEWDYGYRGGPAWDTCCESAWKDAPA